MHRGGGLFDALGTPPGGMVVRVSGIDARPSPAAGFGTLPQTTTMALKFPAWPPSCWRASWPRDSKCLQGLDTSTGLLPLNAFAPEFAKWGID